jgi:asparagine synthase (glutamine-hydrolysing)
MCGINGIIGFEPSDSILEKVRKMNAAVAHRGPDDTGTYQHGQVTLGHQRLSIIDLSSAGHQPMISNDRRYVIAFNGEVYNYRDLRRQLNQYEFKTNTDTEVVLAAFCEWGEKCLDRFNGMFAFAILDTAEEAVFIARDRLGIKPLYYVQKGEYLAFSSEIRGLLAAGLFKAEINPVGLTDYLRYQTVHTPGTILKDVMLLPAGSLLNVSSKGVPRLDIKNWWKPNIHTIDTTYDEAKVCVRELFYKSVERRLMSDVPFGAFLSGGIDSSAVVGVMADVATTSVETFNVSFSEEAFSEAKYARIIADNNKTNHHEIVLSPLEFLEQLPSAIAGIDHPSGDGPNTWVVSKAIRCAGVKMALSGLGGDELFAGYPIFRQMHRLNAWKSVWHMPQSFRMLVGALASKFKPGTASEKIKQILSINPYNFTDIYAVSRQVLLDDKIDDLLSGPVDGNNLCLDLLNTTLSKQNQILSATSVAEICSYMQHVLLRDSDQMSMAHSLELRVPFLDHELVEYALSLPDSIKYPHRPKKLLVDSLKDKLPDEIVDRPKMGFVFPWEHWLRNELFEFADGSIKSLAAREPFDTDAVLSLWVQFQAGDPKINYSRIWPLVVLGRWFDLHGIS